MSADAADEGADAMSTPGDFRPVTQGVPCAICGKPDWCRRSADGAHECHRISESPPNGYKRVAQRIKQIVEYPYRPPVGSGPYFFLRFLSQFWQTW